MTLASETIIATRPLGTLLAAARAALRVRTERRTQRLALNELLHMDPTRLADLGISAQDVLEAIAAPPPAGKFLAARRAAHTTFAAND